MPFDSADAAAALHLFEKLSASDDDASRCGLVSDFFQERSIQTERLDASTLVVRPADAAADAAIDVLLAAPIPASASDEVGLSDLAAFAALARASIGGNSRVAFLASGEASSSAQALPDLRPARALLLPSPERPFEWKGVQIHPIVTAFKGRALVTLTAKGPRANAGHPSTTSAAHHLARALLRLSHQRLPIHVNPPARQMFDALRHKASGPWSLRLLAGCGSLLADMALSGASIQRLPFANRMDTALRNTATPLRVELGSPPASGERPETGTVLLDCRLVPGQSASTLLFELRARLDDAQLELAIHSEHPAVVSTTAAPIVRALEAAVATQSAVPIPWLTAQSPDALALAKSDVPTCGVPIAGNPKQEGPGRAAWTRSLAALFEALVQPQTSQTTVR
ncbi:MAG: hypothetical protein LBM75_09595 [Myxococcales bacterium]|jgi:acetylornithine deacetylase/succinyl-diaminopimelate desuccinylase-like protein|nr:hypothetical protein [Myxococcales bacterium]